MNREQTIQRLIELGVEPARARALDLAGLDLSGSTIALTAINQEMRFTECDFSHSVIFLTPGEGEIIFENCAFDGATIECAKSQGWGILFLGMCSFRGATIKNISAECFGLEERGAFQGGFGPEKNLFAGAIFKNCSIKNTGEYNLFMQLFAHAAGEDTERMAELVEIDELAERCIGCCEEWYEVLRFAPPWVMELARDWKLV